jgi:hypothetical protein
MLLINVYYRGQILNTSTGAGYNIRAACTFSIDETISIHDLKRQIHVSLKMLPSHFNIIISARINTAQQVRGEKNAANPGWFMQCLHKDIIGPGKIIVTSDQHLGIRVVFERSDFEW